MKVNDKVTKLLVTLCTRAGYDMQSTCVICDCCLNTLQQMRGSLVFGKQRIPERWHKYHHWWEQETEELMKKLAKRFRDENLSNMRMDPMLVQKVYGIGGLTQSEWHDKLVEERKLLIRISNLHAQLYKTYGHT